MATTNVFGVIVAGRLLQAEFTQITETDFVTEVSNAESINHVVVFLTGVQPFPDGFGGSVYIRWQNNSVADANWHFLGSICNTKPSAIFRVSNLHKTEAQSASIFGISSVSSGTAGSAQIGVIVESLDVIQSRVSAEGTVVSQQNTVVSFTEKMLQNFFNHICSFALSMPHPQQNNTMMEFVPLKTVQDWFTTFQRRLQMNPNYWKTLS